MNGHAPLHDPELEEPTTYTKSILLRDDRSPTSRRTGSVDSYGTSEGTSIYDSSPESHPLTTVLEHEPKMNGIGLGINRGMKKDESVVTISSSPSSEMEEAPTAEEARQGLDAAKESAPLASKPPGNALASRTFCVGGALAPAPGPPSPPPLIIPGNTSLPDSPDLNKLSSIQVRRLTIPHPTQTPVNSPISPLSGRRGFNRPDFGMPANSSMRITPAVMLTPVVPRPLTLFPLPPVTPIVGEDAEQEARRARRIVPVLMSPGVQEDQEEAGGSSSPGSSDDEGEESDGTSEEGTSTEGDARSTRSSSDGSSNVALSESLGEHSLAARQRTESAATSSSTATARTSRREAATGPSMTSFTAAMAPITRPFLAHTSPDSDEAQVADGTPTPGPSKSTKAKERDYFTSKTVSKSISELSPLHTPKPKATTRPRGATDSDTRSRPNLYHQKSQSLVDLSAETWKIPVPEGAPKPQTILEDEVLVPKAVPAMKRRTSLPAINPPAYSPPHPHSVVARSSAREEEGKEKLPIYSCGVHIEGTLQRKMEFSAPGVQARDRSWKKYWFELHGSSLKVFRQDLRKVPIKGYQAWNGKGCAEAGNARHVHLPEGILEDKDRALRIERAKTRMEEERKARRASVSSATDSRRVSSISASSHTSRATSLAISPPSSSHFVRTSIASSHTPLSSSPTAMNGNHSPPPPPSPERPGPSPFEKLSPPATSVSVPALRDKETRATPASANSTSLRHPHLPSFHHGNAMLRHYTMQGAESGLGADYKKRKNVIRVRAEGEQFLLQADTLVDVVNWIEAFQAATNIALDLDERPMPKLPTLPRRRRRRRPPQDGSTPTTAHPVPASTAVGTIAAPPNSAASTSRS